MATDWLPHQERVTAPLGSLPPLRALPSFRAHDERTATPTTAPTPETDAPTVTIEQPTVTIEQSISGQRSSSSGGGGVGGSGSRSSRSSVSSGGGGGGGGEGDKMKRLQKALDRIRQLVSSRSFGGAGGAVSSAVSSADGGARADDSQAETGAVSSAELDKEVTRGLLRAEVGADAIEDPWSVFVGKQSADCEATCAAVGKRCTEEGLRAINVCSELEKYLKCRGCEVSYGTDQPALVSEDAPAESKPRMCLVNTEAPTCLGFHKLTTRLCACAAVLD